MAIWDQVKQGIDKAGKAAQDVFDGGKLRLEAYRAREQADKAAEALGYAGPELRPVGAAVAGVLLAVVVPVLAAMARRQCWPKMHSSLQR